MMWPPEMGYKPVNESQPIGFGETIIDMAYRFAVMSVDDNGVLDLEKFERKLTELRIRAIPLPGTITITEEELMQYALLHAESHSADTDSLGRIHQRAKEFENEIRSRMVTSATENSVKKTSEIPKIVPPLPDGDTKDLKVWKEYWKVHDENTCKQEREKVVLFIRQFIVNNFEDAGCPFGIMNSTECLEIRDGQCHICIIDHAIEALRSEL